MNNPIITVCGTNKVGIDTLYGEIGGGQLEFVKMDFVWDKETKRRHVRLYFENHDVIGTDQEFPQLYEGKYFVIEVPLT